MTLKDYEKALSELRAAVTSLSEENTLLRDFAYNVDPNARVVHAHMFSKPPPGNGSRHRSHSARHSRFDSRKRSSTITVVDEGYEAAPIPDTYLMGQKVDDLAAKMGKKALSRASGDLVALKSEANYLEQQVNHHKCNES